jgi:tetratricopeptide (TPR) repeat protein
MSIDRADWHYDGKYPKDLPHQNAATHIGMFLAWIIFNGLESEEAASQSGAAIEKVRRRLTTGGQLLMNEFDGKFLETVLSDRGWAFTQAYYEGVDDEPYGQYLMDFVEATDDADLPSAYHVEDSWENYDRVAAYIDAAYAYWTSTGRRPPSRDAVSAGKRPARDAWCKRTTWTEVDKRDFDARLKRSRTAANRAYYLRLQGCTLQETGDHQAALELFERELSERHDPTDLAVTHANIAISLAGTGRLDEAVMAFRTALQTEGANPGVRHSVQLDFIWTVVDRQLVDSYPEIGPLVAAYRDDEQCPFEIWCARAVLADHRGDREEARSMAQRAISRYSWLVGSIGYPGLIREWTRRYRSIKSRLQALVDR